MTMMMIVKETHTPPETAQSFMTQETTNPDEISLSDDEHQEGGSMAVEANPDEIDLDL